MGRPPLKVRTTAIGVRIPIPIWKRVKAEAKKRGLKPRQLGAFVAEILDAAVPAEKEASDGRKS